MKRRTKNKYSAIASPVGFWDRPVSSAILLVLALGMVIVSGTNPSVFNDIRSSTTNAMSPLISVVSYPIQKSSEFVRNVSGLSEMQAKMATLEKENARLREWYQTALVLEEQNKSLKSLLNVKIESKHQYVTGRVIADVGSAFVKSILVKLGYDDGVEKGYAVVSSDGLVGRLINVSEQTSRVLLITDMNSRVPVLIEGYGKNAIMAGKNSSAPILEHLPKEAEIKTAARVMTSGHGGMFPPGIPVGIVARNEDSGAYTVQLFSDMNALQYVRVVSGEDNEAFQALQ